MLYKDKIKEVMTELAKDEKVVFIGEGVCTGGRVYDTMSDVPINKCIEPPIAENLIMGIAMGLAILGYRPVVVFQRMDFMTVASDAIINHLCLIPEMSDHQFELPVIIRAIIGSQDKKFDCGLQHNKDLTHMFDKSIKNTVKFATTRHMMGFYEAQLKQDDPALFIEKKDLYETELD